MPVDQHAWVGVALDLLGTHFGGATAFPRARGVWRDDDQAGRLIFDEPVVIQCYTDEGMLIAHSRELREFLERLGRDTNQGAVGFVIDNDYFEISFP